MRHCGQGILAGLWPGHLAAQKQEKRYHLFPPPHSAGRLLHVLRRHRRRPGRPEAGRSPQLQQGSRLEADAQRHRRPRHELCAGLYRGHRADGRLRRGRHHARGAGGGSGNARRRGRFAGRGRFRPGQPDGCGKRHRAGCEQRHRRVRLRCAGGDHRASRRSGADLYPYAPVRQRTGALPGGRDHCAGV